MEHKTEPYQKIASPKTWGELKAVIAEFPDDLSILWINQKRQSIYERGPYDHEDQNERVIGFQ